MPASPAPVAPSVATADDGEMAPRKVARVLTPLLPTPTSASTWSPASRTCRRATSCSSRGVTGGRPPRPSCSRPRPRCTCWEETTGSPPASCSREPAGDLGWSWSGAATPTSPASPPRRTRRPTPCAPTCAPCRGRPPRPWRPRGCTGSGWGTTTRCSPVPTPAPSGRPATSPTGWSRRSAPSGPTRDGRPTARAGWRTPRSPRRRTSPRTCARPAWSSVVHRSRTGRATARRPSPRCRARRSRRSSNGCWRSATTRRRRCSATRSAWPPWARGRSPVGSPVCARP